MENQKFEWIQEMDSKEIARILHKVLLEECRRFHELDMTQTVIEEWRGRIKIMLALNNFIK